jgi:hypothetical protein
MRLSLHESDRPGFLVYRCEGDDGEVAWESLIPDIEPETYFNRDYQVEDLREGGKGKTLVWRAAASE